MITQADKDRLKEIIQESVTEHYLSAYFAGLGANIWRGEKKARALARLAGCLAIQYSEEDITADHDVFAAVCQAEFDSVLLGMCSEIEAQSAGLILPARLANGNGKLVVH